MRVRVQVPPWAQKKSAPLQRALFFCAQEQRACARCERDLKAAAMFGAAPNREAGPTGPSATARGNGWPIPEDALPLRRGRGFLVDLKKQRRTAVSWGIESRSDVRRGAEPRGGVASTLAFGTRSIIRGFQKT